MKLFRDAASRHGRRKSGMSLCEGVRCCLELLSRRPDWVEQVIWPRRFVDSPDFARAARLATGVPTETVDDSIFNELTETENAQGILCLFRVPSMVDDGTSPGHPLVLVLDRLGDPGNAGTLLRTAWAAGLTDVWLTKGCADPFAPKTLRAGMGAQFALRLRMFDSLSQVREALVDRGYPRLWLTRPRGGLSVFSDLFDMERSGLVIGNEADGVADCPGAESVSIPMPGDAESLNAAQAGTVVLFEYLRRHLQ